MWDGQIIFSEVHQLHSSSDNVLQKMSVQHTEEQTVVGKTIET